MISPDSLPPKSVFHLSVEVSTSFGSLALLDRGDLLWSHSWQRTASHSEILTATLAQGISETGISLKELGFVAVTKGPGSFTGLRVGINLAKTLGMSLSIPIVAPTTLDILAASAGAELPEDAKLLTCMNAFKGMVYWCIYQKTQGVWTAQTPPAATDWRKVSGFLTDPPYHFLGDGFLPHKDQIPKEVIHRLDFRHGEESFPSALVLGPWSWHAYLRSETQTWKTLTPLYLRRSEAEEKRSKEEL